MIVALSGLNTGTHPIFVSVTEIDHNASNKTLSISCKVYASDFETTLRKLYNTKVDLLNGKYKPAMNILINDYFQKHLVVNVDGRDARLQFVGYEQQEEGIICYYRVNNITTFKKVTVSDTILYEFILGQIGIIHIMSQGKRQSFKLNNPEQKASFVFE